MESWWGLSDYARLVEYCSYLGRGGTLFDRRGGYVQ